MILVYLVACDIVNVTGHQFKMPVAPYLCLQIV